MKGIPSITRTIALLVCATFLFVLPFGSASGQVPPVGIIDFYGLRSVSEQQVRQTLQIREGDALPDSVKELERRLEALPNVQQARLERVCCAAVLSRLRQRSVPSLMDMARWKTGHAYAPFFILGRI